MRISLLNEVIVTNKQAKNTPFIQGFKDGIPICLGYFSVAFAFGIFSVGQGLYVWQTILVSMANITSAGQLAGVPIMTMGLPLVNMALSQFVINLRYALMSISLSQKVDSSVRTIDRLIISFVNTDEVFAVAFSQKQKLSRYYLYGLILMPYIGWSGGTTLGALAGNILPVRVISALSIALYAMFIAIVLPPAKKNRAVLFVVIIAAGLSIMFRYLPLLNQVSGSIACLICAVAASAIMAILSPIRIAEADTNSDRTNHTSSTSTKGVN